MTFELESPTAGKLLDLVVLSQKNRQPDENPGGKISFEVTLANHVLSYFDGRLKGFLFAKNASAEAAAAQAQGKLEGVPDVSDMPNLSVIGSKVGTLHWEAEYSGYTLTIDQGLGGPSNLVITDCSLSNFRLTPKEGGTVVTKFDVESADISEASFGRLAKLKSREVKMQLTAPQVEQEDLAGSKRPKATPAPAPVAAPAAAPADTGQTAETVFAEQHGGKAPGAGEADLAAEARRGGEAWPFPTGDNQFKHDPGSAEQAELEKGMAASMAAAGLHPKPARRPRRAAGGAVE